MSKYIFVTGGVVSSLGKGIAAASIGKLLEARGLKTAIIKCDPYLNVDPGTMNPYQHGEVYVTDDGAETDLDLGHYERFTNAKLSQDSSITAGKVYFSVITKERHGDYLGKIVFFQVMVLDETRGPPEKYRAQQKSQDDFIRGQREFDFKRNAFLGQRKYRGPPYPPRTYLAHPRR